MFLKSSVSGATGFAFDPCRVPVHDLSSQTRHFMDRQSAELQRSNRMLSAFVLILGLAVATVMCLLVTSSPVNAMQIVTKSQASTADGLVAIAALISLAASAGVGFALIRLQFSPVRKR